MSSYEEPKIEVVCPWMGAWIPEDDRHSPDRERALLIRGAPMVGDRVGLQKSGGYIRGTVVGHQALYQVLWDGMESPWDYIDLTSIHPLEDERDEALAERLAKRASEAFFGGYESLEGVVHRTVRETIAAMREADNE